MLIKLVHAQEIHLYNGKPILSNIKAHAQKVFRKIPKDFTLSYLDQEGDKITVTTQEDIECLKQGVIKMNIEEPYEGLMSGSESNRSEAEQLLTNHLIAEQPQQQTIRQIASKFIGEIGNAAINKVLQQQNQIIKQCTNEYISHLTDTIANAYVQEQTIFTKKSKIRKSKSLNITLQSHIKNKQPTSEIQTIQSIVQSTINKLLPSIIEKIQNNITSKIIKLNCIKCQKNELQLEKLINQHLFKKYKIQREKSQNK